MTAPTDPTAATDTADEATAEPAERPFGLGSSPLRTDALPKALGIYPYAADLWAEGLLWGAVLRSPHPHARIVSIDTSGALAIPGVHAVLTAADLPAPGTPGARPVLAAEVVRHQGEPVAAVAADHPDTARLAAAAIAVEYQLLDALTDPEQAFHGPALHPDGNLLRHLPLRTGDPEAVGEVVVEGLYQVGRQDPAPIGAEAAWPCRARTAASSCTCPPPTRTATASAPPRAWAWRRTGCAWWSPACPVPPPTARTAPSRPPWRYWRCAPGAR